MNDKTLRKNNEGYNDPTACVAIKRAEADDTRYRRFVGCILRMCELSGFRLEERIVVRDLRTGKVYK